MISRESECRQQCNGIDELSDKRIFVRLSELLVQTTISRQFVEYDHANIALDFVDACLLRCKSILSRMAGSVGIPRLRCFAFREWVPRYPTPFFYHRFDTASAAIARFCDVRRTSG
jgi:hypothetical protein